MNQTCSISLRPWMSCSPGRHLPPGSGLCLDGGLRAHDVGVPAHDRPGRGRPSFAVSRAPHRADEDERSSRRVRVDERLRTAWIEERRGRAAPGGAPSGSSAPSGRRAAEPCACRSRPERRPGDRASLRPSGRHECRGRALERARAAWPARRPGTDEVPDEPVPGGGGSLLLPDGSLHTSPRGPAPAGRASYGGMSAGDLAQLASGADEAHGAEAERERDDGAPSRHGPMVVPNRTSHGPRGRPRAPARGSISGDPCGQRRGQVTWLG